MNDDPKDDVGPELVLAWAAHLGPRANADLDPQFTARPEVCKVVSAFFVDLVEGRRPLSEVHEFWAELAGRYGQDLARSCIVEVTAWGRNGRPPASHSAAKRALESALPRRSRGNPKGRSLYSADELARRDLAWLAADRGLVSEGVGLRARNKRIYETMGYDLEAQEFARVMRRLRRENRPI